MCLLKNCSFACAIDWVDDSVLIEMVQLQIMIFTTAIDVK